MKEEIKKWEQGQTRLRRSAEEKKSLIIKPKEHDKIQI